MYVTTSKLHEKVDSQVFENERVYQLVLSYSKSNNRQASSHCRKRCCSYGLILTSHFRLYSIGYPLHFLCCSFIYHFADPMTLVVAQVNLDDVQAASWLAVFIRWRSCTFHSIALEVYAKHVSLAAKTIDTKKEKTTEASLLIHQPFPKVSTSMKLTIKYGCAIQEVSRVLRLLT